jgi:hypothetical protein
MTGTGIRFPARARIFLVSAGIGFDGYRKLFLVGFIGQYVRLTYAEIKNVGTYTSAAGTVKPKVAT